LLASRDLRMVGNWKQFTKEATVVNSNNSTTSRQR
jgi:hypothetical protein